uniref:Serine aminopeptidase S33 domain-containing protein n=1 Tax=Fibrocapsa japonica TaxID=94617 RepID=A0A7S2Y0T7_9STRA|mmetsp:Transcript_19981/g.28891  ORF Transcript_19981/g.28891 Transcript_19981/m.28891 type:complete len:466 (+) Transcript_19981:3-1400(+)
MTMLSFDCTGSGRSDGDYVSLGFWEREDLKAVIDCLRATGRVSAVALWGRSMGAATSLLHGDRDPSIAAMILDSSFADLHQLATELASRGKEVGAPTPPMWAVRLVLRMVRSSIKKVARFDINKLKPIAHVDKCFIPALYVAGKSDNFIPPSHSQQLFDRHAGDKNIVLVDGDHQSARPKFLHDSVGIFLQNYLQVPTEWALNCDPELLGCPPWMDRNDPYAGMGEMSIIRAMQMAANADNLSWTCPMCTLVNVMRQNADPEEACCQGCGIPRMAIPQVTGDTGFDADFFTNGSEDGSGMPLSEDEIQRQVDEMAGLFREDNPAYPPGYREGNGLDPPNETSNVQMVGMSAAMFQSPGPPRDRIATEEEVHVSMGSLDSEGLEQSKPGTRESSNANGQYQGNGGSKMGQEFCEGCSSPHRLCICTGANGSLGRVPVAATNGVVASGPRAQQVETPSHSHPQSIKS